MLSNKEIIILGSGGNLAKAFKFLSNEFKTIGSNQLNLLEIDSIYEKLETLIPDNIKFVINTSAYTKVDLAEDEQEKSLKLNYEAVKIIAKFCYDKNIKLVHYSTDYVFNGESEIPYVEDSLTSPVNFYGKSKLLGEEAIINSKANACIIRTSWLYYHESNNFFITMLNLFQKMETLKIVNDQFGCPTYALDLARITLEIITNSANNDINGIFHYSGATKCTWFEFTKEIFETCKTSKISMKCNKILPITTSEYPTKAKRPKFSVLNCKKIVDTFKVNQLLLKTSLNECIKNYLRTKND